MTDLTPDELRRACEMAGGEIRNMEYPRQKEWEAIIDGWDYHMDDPALPAYVADLLVAEICRKHMCTAMDRAARRMTDAPACLPAHARIRAALEVLS